MKKQYIFGSTVAVLFLVCGTVFAVAVPSSKLQVAIWIPSWKSTEGILEATENLHLVHEISPFAYYVQSDGTLKDNITTDDAWKYLYDQISLSKNKKIEIIPSILWTDRAQMESILNNKTKRDKHIKEIVTEVVKQKYAGIDIDYEGKSAETRVGFSLFLTDLSQALHAKKKKLVCTIEPRTPVDSRYSVVTQELLAKIEYSNDYKVIGKVCDTVRIMAYDQVGGDVKLENSYARSLYRPVADIEWVKKVLTLTMRDIPARKVFLGVATYGYKYEIKTDTIGMITYSRIDSMNYQYADELAQSLQITPVRHQSGEVYFTYSTSTSVDGTSMGSTKQYLVWYSDAEALKDKMRIAKLYKLGGVALFKIDGANDPKVWSVIK